MKNKPVIAVDIDDVLAAHAEAFTEFSNKRWGTNLTTDDYDEHWAKIWKVDQKELEKRSQELFANDIMSSYRHFPDAEETLKKLQNSYKLVVVTSRRQAISKETTSWIEEHFAGIFSEIHFAGIWDDLEKHTLEKLNLTKTEVVKQIGANYLIDDQPKHCIAAAQAGITSLLFGDYAWNRDEKPRPNMVWVRNWQEVLEYFDGR